MRRAELLIPQVRRATENERVGSTDGISDEEFLQYFTDAVRMLQRQIVTTNPASFRRVLTVAVTGLESYALPVDMLNRNRIAVLEYSPDALAANYYALELRTELERKSIAGYPTQYILQDKTFLVNAFPVSGQFRLTYDYLIPAVDKRRAAVASSTVGATAITALTLSTSAPYDEDDFDLSDNLTIVGFDGTVKMRGIPYTGVTTGVVAIQGSSYTFPSGSTIAVGDYAVLGINASSHPLVDDQAEDFIITYCQKRILMRDSSTDAVDIDPEVQRMAAEVVALYQSNGDAPDVVITNYNYFDDVW